MPTEFQRGTRAMFDYLLTRAANNFHGNPAVQVECAKENDVVTKWASDALAEVDPASTQEWKSVEAAYALGLKHGRNEKKAGR